MFLTSLYINLQKFWEYLIYPSKYYSKKYAKKYAKEYSVGICRVSPEDSFSGKTI